ncbi:glycosyltransferase [Flexivirga sp. B27]
MTTVLIAAYNEEAVIGRTLDRLLVGGSADPLHIIVAANGCNDATVSVASRRPVEVVEVDEAGKAAALNAAERAADEYPRIYLDADVQLDKPAVERLSDAVRGMDDEGRPSSLAAVPSRFVDTSASSRLVRMYYRINALHPSYSSGLFGRGAVAISAAGRGRFGKFPEVIADDLFLDSLFEPSEIAHVDDVVSVVAAAPSARSLLRRLARVRRGNAQLRATHPGSGVRESVGLGWLRAAVGERPTLIPSATVYVALTVLAEARARWGQVPWDDRRSIRARAGTVTT